EFRDGTFLKHLILVLNSLVESFSASKVEIELRVLETQILRVTRNIEATKNRYKLRLAEALRLDEFVPNDIHSAEKDLVSIAGEQSDVGARIFELLYYSLSNPQLADQLFLEMKGASAKDSQLNLLSNFMIAKRIVPPSDFNQYVETLL